ncbi:helix-turn-helix domain-containing protein [Xylophilus rhododendri]|uniref:Helix-turn-helix domain-containing protein n=1 Tax=Xylophilus rhododendri TaxID=2697032 RepID=A0A857J4T1_9BURK|nr:IclR family transcriptional regulator [Xylophilus rhododendri]QHI98109.1 helix-turn-helix domain-containing protein [Xylophilus rhododendri]
MRNSAKGKPEASSGIGTVPAAAESSTGSVVAVTRALDLLAAFALGESQLSLAELSRRCEMHKTTVLRIARTLAMAGYMVQCEDGGWRLGPAAGWLGARYQSGFDMQGVIEPMLRDLVRLTGESAAFYVREGDYRTCLVRVEGPHPLRHHARMGEALPLDKGSPGRVILAFSGQAGKVYEAIRSRGYHLSIGEREKGVATVSAPVFGLNWKLLGSVCISGPASRLSEARLQEMAQDVMGSANQLSYSLAGARSMNTPQVVSTWHP